MVKNRKTPASRYIKNMRRKLLLPGKYKNQLLNEITADVLLFQDEHPDCTYEDITRHFGFPDEMARESFNSAEVEELSKKYKRFIVLCIGISAVIIICLMIVILHILSLQAVRVTETIIYYN